VEYCLSEYTILPFGVVSKWEKSEGSPTDGRQEVVAKPAKMGLQLDGQEQATIVVFDPYLMALSETPASALGLPLEHGGELTYFVLAESQAFHYGSGVFGIIED
jgi:hypothetical protein